VIPIHIKDKRVFRALSSLEGVDDTQVNVCTSREIGEWIDNEYDGDEKFWNYVFCEDTSYEHMTNAGIHAFADDVEFVSILEFDDRLNSTAHASMEPYLKENESVGIFLPLAYMVVDDATDGDERLKVVAMLNEAPLANGMFEDYGTLDLDTMMKANFAFINGSYFKPEVFEKFGMLKTKFEMFSDYEFIMRMIYNGVETMTIPKVARFHFLSEDGVFQQQKNSEESVRAKWLQLARSEYMFTDDRDLEI